MKILVSGFIFFGTISAHATDLVCMGLGLDKFPTAIIMKTPQNEGVLFQSFVQVMKIYSGKVVPAQFKIDDWMQDTAGRFMYKEIVYTGDDGLNTKIIRLGGGRSGALVLALTENSNEGFSGKLHGDLIPLPKGGVAVKCQFINP